MEVGQRLEKDVFKINTKNESIKDEKFTTGSCKTDHDSSTENLEDEKKLMETLKHKLSELVLEDKADVSKKKIESKDNEEK